MNDRKTKLLEVAGLFLLAGSLIFVAIQIRQEHALALASLASERTALFTSRHVAGLESDAYLSLYYKNYRTNGWDVGDLENNEVAAAEIDALIAWTYYEMSYTHWQAGFVSDLSWESMKIEIAVFAQVPVYQAIYDYWYSKVPGEFTRFVNTLLEDGIESSPTSH